MLYSVVLELESLEPCLIGSGSGYQAYGLFLRLLDSRWPETSQRLHQQRGPKSFTLSPVKARGKRIRDGVHVTTGATASIRITCLDPGLMDQFFDSVIRWPDDHTVLLGEARFLLKGLTTLPNSAFGCRVATSQELVEVPPADGSFSLQFASPTTFRSGGRRNVVAASPRLVFHSLLARWNQYAPESLRLTLPDDLEAMVFPRDYRLSTRKVDFGTYLEQGFQGRCEYQFADGAGERLRQALGTLAEFAYFAGVGAKTTMGMGQCWKVNRRRVGSGIADSGRQTRGA